LYRNLIVYHPIKQRELVKIEYQDIIQDLDFWVENNHSTSIEQVIEFATRYATDNLKYTFDKCSTNPNQLVSKQNKTNCIGYSASLHAVLTYLLKKKGFSEKVKSEHKVAQLYFWSFNIHTLFSDSALQNHDYNVVTDFENHKKYVIDPTIRANLGILTVTENKIF
jgi:hypothetical protein